MVSVSSLFFVVAAQVVVLAATFDGLAASHAIVARVVEKLSATVHAHGETLVVMTFSTGPPIAFCKATMLAPSLVHVV